MMGTNRTILPWIAAGVAALAVLPACDQGYSSPMDALADNMTDTAADTSEESTGPCTYPEGPHAFTGVGDIVGRMIWPSAVKGPAEDTEAPDFLSFHCNPDLRSIFIHYGAQT
jgi:hypothetical protein